MRAAEPTPDTDRRASVRHVRTMLERNRELALISDGLHDLEDDEFVVFDLGRQIHRELRRTRRRYRRTSRTRREAA